MRARCAVVLVGMVASACSNGGACPSSTPGARMLALTREREGGPTVLSMFDVGPAACRVDLRELVPVPYSNGWGSWAPHGGTIVSIDHDSLQIADVHQGVGNVVEVDASGAFIAFDSTARWIVWLQTGDSLPTQPTVHALSAEDSTSAPILLGDSLTGDDVGVRSSFEPRTDRFAQHGSGIVRVVDLAAASGPTTTDWTFPPQVLVPYRWSPAGRWIAATIDQNGRSVLIDTSDPSTAPFPIGGSFAWSPDGHRIAAAGTTIFDVTTGTPTATHTFPGGVHAQWLDQSRLVAEGDGGSLVLLDADTGQSSTLVTGVVDWYPVPDDAVTYETADGAWHWMRTHGATHDLAVCAAPYSSPDGRFIVCVAPPDVLVADTTTGTTGTVNLHSLRSPNTVMWSADSTRAWIDGEQPLVLDPSTLSLTPPPDVPQYSTAPIGWEPTSIAMSSGVPP